VCCVVWGCVCAIGVLRIGSSTTALSVCDRSGGLVLCAGVNVFCSHVTTGGAYVGAGGHAGPCLCLQPGVFTSQGLYWRGLSSQAAGGQLVVQLCPAAPSSVVLSLGTAACVCGLGRSARASGALCVCDLLPVHEA
jgi:hypothetical protein